ncbi:MFS transporter [Pseudonocardia sp. HH130630-07]|uniref:MFS transporter n=1 Tax=Pseudonocardia sp. HH130630-07 TaxID=1690815 RepID=UPI0009F1E5F6|nr:MFS transporter [Pseudonocardia sp. HH130630-07]
MARPDLIDGGRPPRRPTTGGALRHSPSIWLASYGLSLLGKGVASVVMPLLVLDRTGDVLAAGLLATVGAAVSAATGLVSGLLVDRVDRRAVSITSDVLAAISVAALPVIDAVWGLNMTWFLVLGVLGAMIRVPGMTAQETLLPVLVRLGPDRPGRLDRLIAIRETVGNVLLLAGPGFGGLLIGLLGLTPALLFATAATTLLGALLTLVLDPRAGAVERTPVPAGQDTVGGAVRRAVTDLVDSWRFLTRHALVLGATLVSAMLVAVLASLQSTLMPAYFTAENLPALTGLTLSAIAAGSIGGSALYAATAGRVRRRVWFVIGMLGTLTGFAAVGSMASPWLVLGGAALVGLTNAPVSAVLGVLTVEATPDAMRGRVLGAQNTVMQAAPAITTAPLAAIASGAGLPAAGLVLAVLAGITALVALAVPAFRVLDDPAAVRAMAAGTQVTVGADGPDPNFVDAAPASGPNR